MVSQATKQTIIQLTEVLHVLVREESQSARSLGAGLGAGLLGLVDDGSISQGGGKESGAIAEDSHARVVVHANPGKDISGGHQDQGKVTGVHVSMVLRPVIALPLDSGITQRRTHCAI